MSNMIFFPVKLMSPESQEEQTSTPAIIKM